MNEKIEKLLSIIPQEPGVYKFYDRKKKIIYIGKAKNLYRRVNSYFNNMDKLNPKNRVMVSNIDYIDYIVVNNDREAYLLENALIKENKPKYNILLKDDKTYPWICITNEIFPRIYTTRRLDRKKGRFYGPYSSSYFIKLMLKQIKGIIPYRGCKLNLEEQKIAEGVFTSCLEYHIHRCNGPCIGKQSKEEYAESISRIENIIKGKTQELVAKLEEELEELINSLAFEKAELLSRQIKALGEYTAKNSVVNPQLGNWDVITIVHMGERWMANYMQLTQGTITLSVNKEVLNPLEEEPQNLLNSLSYHFSTEFRTENARLITNIKNALPTPEYNSVYTPKAGDKMKVILLSEKNAYNELNKTDHLREIEGNRKLLENIKKELLLNRLPVRIECIDNSNTQGTYPVSACVVFENGKPFKSEYRCYNIRTVIGPDDYSTMREVIQRRYEHRDIRDLPDLLVVDGGKGQLSAAIQTLQEIKRIGYFDVVGLAEREEEIFIPRRQESLILDLDSDVLRTIIQLRDEAHRFGIEHHRRKRDGDIIRTGMEAIPGIGPKTIATILSHYTNLGEVQEHGFEKLANLIGRKKAEILWKTITEKKNGT